LELALGIAAAYGGRGVFVVDEQPHDCRQSDEGANRVGEVESR